MSDNLDLARSRVAITAKLLDEHVPGWAEEIHLLDLDMRSPRLCVVGQIYNGEFGQGVREMCVLFGRPIPFWGDPLDAVAEEMGLEHIRGTDSPDYSALQIAWHEEITARR